MQKLNLGCGLDYRAGYINVDNNDSHKADLVEDITWLKSIDNRSCGEAIAQDVLEHLPRAKCSTALAEWNRVLVYGGTLTIRVPSLLQLLTMLSEASTVPEQKKLIQLLYGTQGYSGDFHLNGFTEGTLREDLTLAGFRVESIVLIDRWLFEVVASKINHVQPRPMLRMESDDDFLEAAYTITLGRPSDVGGKQHFAGLLKAGIAREAIIEVLQAAAASSAESTAVKATADAGIRPSETSSGS